jgi:hypothetical protein
MVFSYYTVGHHLSHQWTYISWYVQNGSSCQGDNCFGQSNTYHIYSHIFLNMEHTWKSVPKHVKHILLRMEHLDSQVLNLKMKDDVSQRQVFQALVCHKSRLLIGTSCTNSCCGFRSKFSLSSGNHLVKQPRIRESGERVTQQRAMSVWRTWNKKTCLQMFTVHFGCPVLQKEKEYIGTRWNNIQDLPFLAVRKI